MKAGVAVLALLAGGTAIAATPDRPVRIGTVADDLDACLSQGEVTGLDPAGDNFLTVRAGPGRDARDIGRLGPGHIVNICEDRSGWLGVVFGPRGRPEEDCGVGSPGPSPRAYDGPCHSGWVSGRYVRVVAG